MSVFHPVAGTFARTFAVAVRLNTNDKLGIHHSLPFSSSLSFPSLLVPTGCYYYLLPMSTRVHSAVVSACRAGPYSTIANLLPRVLFRAMQASLIPAHQSR